jgi:hypothetical protein
MAVMNETVHLAVDCVEVIFLLFILALYRFLGKFYKIREKVILLKLPKLYHHVPSKTQWNST